MSHNITIATTTWLQRRKIFLWLAHPKCNCERIPLLQCRGSGTRIMATIHDAQCVIVAWSHGTSFLLVANAGRQHSRHIKKGCRKQVEQPRIKSFRGQPTKNRRKSIRGQPKKGRIQSFRWLPKKSRRLAEQKRVRSCLLVHSFSQTVTVWLMFRQYTNKTVDLWRHYKMTSPRSGTYRSKSIIMKMIVQYWVGHCISVASIVGLLYMLDFLPKTCC